ncbi:MAG: hypothetical protein WCI75_05265 [candidate division NC10 bacterium]
MKIKVTEEIWKEGNMYASYCPELDMASCGESVEESKKNLKEVISINFAECRNLMSAIRPTTYQIQVKIFEAAGCRYVRTQGDHMVPLYVVVSGVPILLSGYPPSGGLKRKATRDAASPIG